MLSLSLNLGINNVNRGVPPFKADLAFDWFKRDTGSLVLQDKVDGNDAAVVGGWRGVIASTATLSFSDLSGVTIVSSIGTSTPTVNGNDIDFTTGNIEYLELSDGTKMYFNGHLYDSFSGLSISGTGFTYELINDTNPQSTLTALDNGYYRNDADPSIQVVNPQYALPAGWTAFAGGKLHNFIDSYVDLQPSDAAMALETELVTNGDFDSAVGWIGTGSIASGQGILTFGKYLRRTDFVTGRYFIVSINVDAASNNFYIYKAGIADTNLSAVSLEAGLNEFIMINTVDVESSTLITIYNLDATAQVNVNNFSVKRIPSIYEIFNKANETIYNDIFRDSVFFDSSNPFLFHISETLYDTWNAALNTAYKDRNFTGIKTNYGEQLSIFRIYSRLTQSTGQALIDDLNYINYNYLPTGAEAVVKDGEQSYLNGSLVYKL